MLNKRNAYSFSVIILISLLSYFNTFQNSFHFDDHDYILNNEAFKEHLNYTFTIGSTLSNLRNRSVVLHSLYLNYSVGGFNVFGFHVVNLTVHTLTCLLIFILLKETLRNFHFSKNRFKSDTGINIPLLSSILFAVHPINTQAVTYISNRSTLLATFFYLLSFIFFIRSVRSISFSSAFSFIFLSAISLLMGFGSKTIIITFPALFIIFYLLFLSQKTSVIKKDLLNKLTSSIGFCIIASPLILALFSKQISYQRLSAINSKLLSPILGTLIMALDVTEDYISSFIYLLTEFKVIISYYLKIIFFPFNQNIDPDFLIAQALTDIPVLFSLFLIISLLIIGLYFYKKNPLITFGIFWFYITLLPTSSIIPLLDPVAEHRVYLPSIGIAMIISVFLNDFYKKKKTTGQATSLIFIIAPIVILSSLTIQRNFIWKDEVSLWSDAAEKSPLKPRPFNNLGEAYEKKADYQKAIHSLKKAISLAPDFDYAHNNLGTVYGKLNQFDLAIKEYLHVLKVNDQFTAAHYNLGKSYEMKEMFDDAVQEYLKAIEQQPDFYQAYFNLASIYSKSESYKEAISTYQKFLKYKPSYPAAHFELGKIYLKIENSDIAFKHFSKSLKLDRNYVPARIALGNIYFMRGSYDKAEESYQQVLTLDPDNFTTHNNLGLIYLQYKNKPSQAVYYFQKSLKINPSQPHAKSIMEKIKNILNN
ncbi:MAG TPA: tetratricopeptide repeat protein [Nitrospinota bacterium]|nr:tetratricopeptide repeat protein [Nitrospinota bacterium]